MSFFAESKFVWKNGQIIPWEQATIHMSAHGLHYGTGVFEGIRCYDTVQGPAIFRLDAHLERMFESAKTYGLPIPYSIEELTQGALDVVEANGFQDCYLRPIAFYGSGSLGVHPKSCPVDVALMAWPWGAYLGADALEKGIQVTVSRWKKFSSLAMPATAKACGQYLNSMLAVQDAVRRGFDEALLVDEDGIIAEGSGENFFMVRDGNVLTNDERDHVLMGITRDSVITLARDLGYKVYVGEMRLEELEVADEAFFTGTAAEVTPIAALDRRPIGNGKPGPITLELQKAYFAATQGRDPKHQHWLTPAGVKAAAEQEA
ncbi:MAG TPA: branched-chain amino acid transaminase [Candidatus Angelobacter sp.]|jgi:branched-chain amino acid aminotransferase|nr:branched-chain amino acid transaminase [Candidatus Angelobacter sp.]